jgi:hypothetical protein
MICTFVIGTSTGLHLGLVAGWEDERDGCVDHGLPTLTGVCSQLGRARLPFSMDPCHVLLRRVEDAAAPCSHRGGSVFPGSGQEARCLGTGCLQA